MAIFNCTGILTFALTATRPMKSRGLEVQQECAKIRIGKRCKTTDILLCSCADLIQHKPTQEYSGKFVVYGKLWLDYKVEAKWEMKHFNP